METRDQIDKVVDRLIVLRDQRNSLRRKLARNCQRLITSRRSKELDRQAQKPIQSLLGTQPPKRPVADLSEDNIQEEQVHKKEDKATESGFHRKIPKLEESRSIQTNSVQVFPEMKTLKPPMKAVQLDSSDSDNSNSPDMYAERMCDNQKDERRKVSLIE